MQPWAARLSGVGTARLHSSGGSSPCLLAQSSLAEWCHISPHNRAFEETVFETAAVLNERLASAREMWTGRSAMSAMCGDRARLPPERRRRRKLVGAS